MTGNEYMINIIADAMVCPSCLRIRFSPLHLAIRLFGMCPGRKGWTL